MTKHKITKVDALLGAAFLINLSIGIFYWSTMGFWSGLSSLTNSAWTLLIFFILKTMNSLRKDLEQKNSEIASANERIAKMLDEVEDFKRSMRI
jgi:hypothetical protein